MEHEGDSDTIRSRSAWITYQVSEKKSLGEL